MKSFFRGAGILLVLSALAVSPFPALAGSRSDSPPFAAVRERMQGFVENGTIAGAVTLIAQHGEIVNVETVGYADIGAKKPMREDALFWIASMTKPIAGIAVLMMQDEGRLSIEDPVEQHLPEFKGMWMTSETSDQRRVLVPAPRPITVRDLLTHTSGLDDTPAPRSNCTLAELGMAYSQRPLRFSPGSRWEYSNSGINTLGRIVEVVSGEKFEDFVQRRIFTPLRMKDTTFWPSPARAKRVAKSYKPGANGQGLEETPVYFIKGDLSGRTRTPFPAGGLYSTARDMANLYQTMLNQGEWRGKRILSKTAVAQLTRTQTGEIRTGFVDGMSWGLGFQVVKEPKGVTGMLSSGTFGHGGAYATQSWADPAKDAIFILMIQRAGFPNGDDSPVRKAFQEAAVSSLRN